MSALMRLTPCQGKRGEGMLSMVRKLNNCIIVLVLLFVYINVGIVGELCVTRILQGLIQIGQSKPHKYSRKAIARVHASSSLVADGQRWAKWVNRSLQMSLAFCPSHHCKDSHRLIVTNYRRLQCMMLMMAFLKLPQ